jgi:hypothetical protein
MPNIDEIFDVLFDARAVFELLTMTSLHCSVAQSTRYTAPYSLPIASTQLLIIYLNSLYAS